MLRLHSGMPRMRFGMPRLHFGMPQMRFGMLRLHLGMHCLSKRKQVELLLNKSASKWSRTTKCGRRGAVCPHPLILFCFEIFDWFFRVCRQFVSYSRKIIENLQFAVQVKNLPKNLFCPTTTYSGLCSSDHTCMKNLFLVGFLGLGVIYSEKIEIRRSHPKLCKLFPQASIHLKGTMLIYRLMPP